MRGTWQTSREHIRGRNAGKEGGNKRRKGKKKKKGKLSITVQSYLGCFRGYNVLAVT